MLKKTGPLFWILELCRFILVLTRSFLQKLNFSWADKMKSGGGANLSLEGAVSLPLCLITNCTLLYVLPINSNISNRTKNGTKNIPNRTKNGTFGTMPQVEKLGLMGYQNFLE